jgi:sensor c-di-GMP phosphodiesterase-like protein
LRAAGFDYAQGFLFTGALAPDECERWMAAFNAQVPVNERNEDGRYGSVRKAG